MNVLRTTIIVEVYYALPVLVLILIILKTCHLTRLFFAISFFPQLLTETGFTFSKHVKELKQRKWKLQNASWNSTWCSEFGPGKCSAVKYGTSAFRRLQRYWNSWFKDLEDAAPLLRTHRMLRCWTRNFRIPEDAAVLDAAHWESGLRSAVGHGALGFRFIESCWSRCLRILEDAALLDTAIWDSGLCSAVGHGA